MAAPLELLAPARTAEIGIEAVKHGADAVYIGGPAFGARHGAANTVAEIARLAEVAHRFRARVFVTLNTIFRDDELDHARRIAWQAYDAGADALILQDMGLLELDLPPIQLHASTQTDIRTPEKAAFLAGVGFSQLVLARELSLPEIAAIRERVGVGDGAPLLEYFVHGALCVAYSGQCYISHAHTGRSANRGECSQACRLPYTLEDGRGRIVAHDKHLLSMKDNDQSANLRLLADAGIRSFKIEGRLKDVSYVKNATAHYRRLIDRIVDEDPATYSRASSGRCTTTFTPRPEKTFNRGSTDYFTHGRRSDIGAFDAPGFAGAASGVVTALGPDWIEVDSAETFANGDGITYLARGRKLAGLRVNLARRVADRWRLTPNAMPEHADDLRVGAPIHRNHDQAFERLLERESAERRIGVTLRLEATGDGTALTVEDEDGIAARAAIVQATEPARNPERARIALTDALGKLGGTDFRATSIDIGTAEPGFLPAAMINALRRDAIEALVAERERTRPRLARTPPVDPPVRYPGRELSYLGNVLNARAREFYRRHGVELVADAYEADTTSDEVSLMITRHCLRYSHSLCPKEAKGWVAGVTAEPMTLVNGGERLTLEFDCKRCEMHVVGRLRRPRTIPIRAA
ncbi:MAG: U32 family peptidase [Burkholderiales bacterium]